MASWATGQMLGPDLVEYNSQSGTARQAPATLLCKHEGQVQTDTLIVANP